MRIEYLELRNFASVYTAMNKKVIKIDFNKCKNSVVLLVGKNGSGKTSILSALHPFAYQGNMDVRSTTKLILDGEDGYKEIHIRNGLKLYTIIHVYKYTKNGYQLKSYISKNGTELNPNGNVGSFNEVVETELSIQQDYLKLLRLGSNVTNIIEMKAAERKNFTSDLLSDIGIYTTLYKKINDDNRLLKNMISSVTSKIDRLAVTDEESLVGEIDKIASEISELESLRSKLQSNMGEVIGSISTILPDGVSATRSKRADTQYKISSIEDSIQKYTKEAIKCKPDEGRDNLQDELSANTTTMAELRASVVAYTDFIDSLYKKRDTVVSRLNAITSDNNYEEMCGTLDRLKYTISRYEAKHDKAKPKYSKDTLVGMINTLHSLATTVGTIFTYNMVIVKECINGLLNGDDVAANIEEKISSLDSKIATAKAKSRMGDISNTCLVMFRPPNCPDDTCPYLSLYDRFFNINETDDTTVGSMEAERRKLLEMSDIYNNLVYVVKTCNAVFPKDESLWFLSTKNILTTIYRGINVDTFESSLTEIIADVEDYDAYVKVRDEARELELEIAKMSNSGAEISNLKSEIDSLTDEITTVNTNLTECNSKLNTVAERTDTITRLLALYDKYDDLMKSIAELNGELGTLHSELDTVDANLAKVSDLELSQKQIESDLQLVVNRLDGLKKMLFDKQYTLKEYTTLCNDRDTLNDKYEDVSIIREALSSTKGIPLLFIQLYLKNTRMFVNSLLASVYEDFEIDDFEISATEFNIPYIKNGIRIPDVVYASQGERSFLSLALSFALINQSIKNYNILLLDEIDSTLDIRNRAMFLNILTQQMESIDSEQVFLITHNNMFDSYPVDVIMTSDVEIDSYTNANIIYK